MVLQTSKGHTIDTESRQLSIVTFSSAISIVVSETTSFRKWFSTRLCENDSSNLDARQFKKVSAARLQADTSRDYPFEATSAEAERLIKLTTFVITLVIRAGARV